MRFYLLLSGHEVYEELVREILQAHVTPEIALPLTVVSLADCNDIVVYVTSRDFTVRYHVRLGCQLHNVRWNVLLLQHHDEQAAKRRLELRGRRVHS